MSTESAAVPPIPDDTARIARYPVREGSFYRAVGDRLPLLIADIDVNELYLDEPPPAPPTLMCLMTIFQYVEGLSDAQTVAAVRRRIDWKYALHLPLNYPSFDHQVLADFRERMLTSRTAKAELERLLGRLRDLGLGRQGSRAAVSSFYVLTSVRTLNRLLLVRRTMALAVDAVATCEPDWAKAVIRPSWHERYGRTHTPPFRPPSDPEKGEALAAAIGADGDVLLKALGRADTPRTLGRLPEVELLRHVWRWQFDERKATANLRPMTTLSSRSTGKGFEAGPAN